MQNIVIESDRLIMTQIDESSWPLFLRLHQEPEVIKKCFDEPATSEIRHKFDSRLAPWSSDSQDWLCLVIKEKDSNKSIGITGFVFDKGIGEVGYLLLPEFYGKGYATESLTQLLSWAKAQHGIDEFKAVVTEGNRASERVLMKSDFRLDEKIKDAYAIGGKLYADHIYKHTSNQKTVNNR